MTEPELDSLASGRAALRDGDPARARHALSDIEPASGDVIECLARASYLELSFLTAIEGWEQAYRAFREGGDRVGSVRVARTLSYMQMAIVGDRAVASGWLARAQTLLGEDTDTSERGWVALNVGMFASERDRKAAYFREALDVARSLGDSDLEFVALAYLGASLVHADDTEEGMALLDEALAAVAGQEVDDFMILEEIFCQLFSACEHAHDVSRADQWIRVGDTITTRRKLPAVSAFCRTHYGGVLTAAGRWTEADAALSEAARLWELGQRSGLRGGAMVRLANLRVRQGRFEEASQLLIGFDVVTDLDAAGALAAIHLARGELSLAADVIERALEEIDQPSSAAVPLLALLVDVLIAAEAIDESAAASARLAACSAASTNPYTAAVAALARGRVMRASGSGDPQSCLREAIAGFTRAHMPLEAAHARLELATALVADRPEVAAAEARTAFDAFDQLHASRHTDEAAAVLRMLGVRTVGRRPVTGDGGVLSKREAEVLDLLGHGLSNPEISERLYISRKTVEHHVGHILAKLGLRSRGEAAAYAARNPSERAREQVGE